MSSWAVVLLIAIPVGAWQTEGSGADQPRVAAVRWVVDSEIRALARARIPAPSEGFAFCVGSTRQANQKGPAPTSLEDFVAVFRDVVNPSRDFLAEIRDSRVALYGVEGCREIGGLGWLDVGTGRATRGCIQVGPAYQVQPQYTEVPVQILRHITSADGWVLRLQPSTDGWKVVAARHVWGA